MGRLGQELRLVICPRCISSAETSGSGRSRKRERDVDAYLKSQRFIEYNRLERGFQQWYCKFPMFEGRDLFTDAVAELGGSGRQQTIAREVLAHRRLRNGLVHELQRKLYLARSLRCKDVVEGG